MSSENEWSPDIPHQQDTELLNAVERDFAENPEKWEKLWNRLSEQNPELAKQLNLYATRVGNRGLHPKFAVLQGIITSYAIREKRSDASFLAGLFSENTTAKVSDDLTRGGDGVPDEALPPSGELPDGPS